MKSIFQLFDLKPIRFECHHVRCLVLFIMPGKIFLQPFKNIVGIVIVQHTLIQVRTMATFVAFNVMSVQWHLPYAGEYFWRTGSTFAFVRYFVVECVRPDGQCLRFYRNRTIVNVAKVFNNLQQSWMQNSDGVNVVKWAVRYMETCIVYMCMVKCMMKGYNNLCSATMRRRHMYSGYFDIERKFNFYELLALA